MRGSLRGRDPVSLSRSSTWASAGRGLLGVVFSVWPGVAASLDAQERGDVPQAQRVPLLDNVDAWERLPECPDGDLAPLPNWARALAATLPHTTAAMLELDGLYRTTPELEPALRAKLRWVAAQANGCRYTQAYAAADFQRSGGDPAALHQLAERDDLPAGERAVLEFARQMTLDASAVTDEDVARLIEFYGEKAVVAMVLELAYANFQDRLILALDLPLEEQGPLPPGRYRFPALEKLDEIPRAERPEAPGELTNTPADAALPPAPGEDAEWSSLDLAKLGELLDAQRERPGRVRVPDWESVRERLPPEIYPVDRPLKIKWSLVVLGHQPEMGMAWMRCLRAFGREADLDGVLAESVFWVITRTIHCFY